jgi:hypothetical protein
MNIVRFLQEHLSSQCHDLYVAAVGRPTNIVRFACGTFEYSCDGYSKLLVRFHTIKQSRIESLRCTGLLCGHTNHGMEVEYGVGSMKQDNWWPRHETKDTSLRTVSAVDSM